MARSKYINHFCAYCHKDTKMEIVGGKAAGGNVSDPLKMWFRCLRCKHSAMIDRNLDQKWMSEKMDRETATEYTATKVYAIGQTIYHSTWDDLGRVMSKIKTSGGVHAITVSFQKLGERKLVENLAKEALQDNAA
ncbi:MAG: hypothetical protein WEB37_13435 [Bacteroidota bacterium]